MDVLDVLRADHARIRACLGDIGAGPPSGVPEHRVRVKERLVVACSKHEALEEMILWPDVEHRLAQGAALASAGCGQEELATALLEDLDGTPVSSAAFPTLLGEVASSLRRHMTFEEHEVFPSLSRSLSGEEAATLARRVDAARRLAPTRPHATLDLRPG